MKSFLNWLREDGYYIKDSYDPVTGVGGIWGKMVAMGVQPAIFEHVLTPREDGSFPYTTIIYSSPKKSGKSAVASAIGCYVAENFLDGTEIYVLANDVEQTSRVYDDIYRHFGYRNEHPEVDLGGQVDTYKSRITLPNGTFIQPLAQEHTSAAGTRHALTIWDELWGYTSDKSKKLWAEMTPIPPIPGVPVSLRVIVTYAGYENDESPLRELYDMVVDEAKKGINTFGGAQAEVVPELEFIKDAGGNPVCFKKGRIFVYWDTEPRMPWQTPEYYEEQAATLSPMQMLRLHHNQWVTGKELFIPIAWWDRAQLLDSPLMYDPKNPYRQYHITIGVDVGWKHDTSAIVGTWFDSNLQLTGLAAHKIIVPSGDLSVNMEHEIIRTILEWNTLFSSVSVIADPSNFFGGIIELRKRGIAVTEFTQQGQGMLRASDNLYTILKNKVFVTYEAPDLRGHIVNAVAKNEGHGIRIVKEKNSRAHVDGAVALAMSAYDARINFGSNSTDPVNFELPFSEERMSPEELKRRAGLATLPPEFRDFKTKGDIEKAWEEWDQQGVPVVEVPTLPEPDFYLEGDDDYYE